MLAVNLCVSVCVCGTSLLGNYAIIYDYGDASEQLPMAASVEATRSKESSHNERAHTYRHTPTHCDTHRQAHKRFLLICCICYGAHLLASSSMCVLSTVRVWCVCVCVCAATASVCYLCCDNRFKRFTHSPGKCNLSSFSWTLTCLPQQGAPHHPTLLSLAAFALVVLCIVHVVLWPLGLCFNYA